MLENGGGSYRNYSGCGNTLNGNHPIVREMIFHCLRYWVHNYHVDGFRFDLASILSRNRDGELVPNPPVVESIGEDPLAGRHEDHRRGVGRRRRLSGGHVRQPPLGRMERPFPRRSPPLLARRPEHGRPAGHAPGRLQRSVPGRRAAARTTASTSSPPTTASRSTTWSPTARNTTRPTAKTTPTARRTISATTTASKVPPAAPAVEAVRLRQIKNFIASLLLSQGVPMLLCGRRMPPHPGRQQQRLLPGQRHLLVQLETGREARGTATVLPGVGGLSQGRAHGATDRFSPRPPAGPGRLPDVSWFSPSGGQIDWSSDSRSLVCLLAAALPDDPSLPPNHHVLMLFHAGTEARHFILPLSARGIFWRLFLNTAAETPDDIYPALDGPPPPANGCHAGGAFHGGLHGPRREAADRMIRVLSFLPVRGAHGRPAAFEHPLNRAAV